MNFDSSEKKAQHLGPVKSKVLLPLAMVKFLLYFKHWIHYNCAEVAWQNIWKHVLKWSKCSQRALDITYYFKISFDRVSFWSIFFKIAVKPAARRLLWVTMGHVTVNCTFDLTPTPFRSLFCNLCIYSVVLHYFLVSWQSLVTFEKSCYKVNGCGIEYNHLQFSQAVQVDWFYWLLFWVNDA